VEGKAFLLGCANLISVVLVEDFAWFVNKWLFSYKMTLRLDN
jgi:hypothetical protein